MPHPRRRTVLAADLLLHASKHARPRSVRSAALIHRQLTAAALVAVALTTAPRAQLQFAASPPIRPSGVHAAGDVDGDGDVDLVFGMTSGLHGAQNRLYLNDGRGGFVDATATHMPVDGDFTLDIALADVDGDGDLDLIVGNSGFYLSTVRQNRLYRNDGAGVFTDVTAGSLPVDADHTHAVALGDVDGDDDLDLLLANGGLGGYGGPNRLLLNDGAGNFTSASGAALPTATDESHDVVLGDVDDDGDLDLVVANGYIAFQYTYGSPNVLYLNNGNGTFVQAPLPLNDEITFALVLGDVDGDGDLDLYSGNARGYQSQWQDTLYLNAGNGTFVDVTASHLPSALTPTYGVGIGDVDGDGDVDLAVGGPYVTGFAATHLYLNDSHGVYADATASHLPSPPPEGGPQTLIDLDLDGDLDLLGGGATVLWNLQRQLAIANQPQIGHSVTIELHARSDAPRLLDVALPYLALAPAAIAVPALGTLGIDPTQAAPLPPLLIPQPAGLASTSFPVPNNPAVVGIELFAQALHVAYPLSPRLTNATSATVQ